MSNGIQDIRKLSTYYPNLETLIHYVNYDTLLEEHKRQLSSKAVGVDGVTKKEYDSNIEENLTNLVKRMKSFSYRPRPLRRTYIPKANGKLRPLGIPSYEDKLVQGVMARILNEVYVFVNLNVSHFWLKYQSKSEPHFFLSFTMNGKGGYQKGDKTYEQIRNH